MKRTILTTAAMSQNSTSAPDIKTKNRWLLLSRHSSAVVDLFKVKDNLSNKGDARCFCSESPC